MLSVIIDKIQKDHGDDAVTGIFIAIISELKKKLKVQQKELDKINKHYNKLEKTIQTKKKKNESAFPYFNAVYTGDVNKKNIPNGKGTLVYASRDKDYPDDNDIYVGEFFNGTKTGIGKYIYFNDRNIAQHPFTIPYYVGEWSGDFNYGLGSTMMDKFETIHTYEGEYKNNKIFGFGKWTDKNNGKGDVELIGYFDDGVAVGFGLRITKDENGKIIPDFSGLCEYDNSDPKNKKSIIHFSFPDNSFWDLISDKEKTSPLVKKIFDTIIDKGYFAQDLRSEKLQKLKLKAQSQHVELLFEMNSLLEKNNQNKNFVNLLKKQGDIKNKLFNCTSIKEIEDVQKLVNESIKNFKTLKKNEKK